MRAKPKEKIKMFLKVGHRGARGYEIENTLESFKKAIELGVDAIELDVRKWEIKRQGSGFDFFCKISEGCPQLCLTEEFN